MGFDTIEINLVLNNLETHTPGKLTKLYNEQTFHFKLFTFCLLRNFQLKKIYPETLWVSLSSNL